MCSLPWKARPLLRVISTARFSVHGPWVGEGVFSRVQLVRELRFVELVSLTVLKVVALG